MKKTLKFVLSALVIALTANAYAQTSVTKTATAGQYGTDVDNFMNVNGYSKVEFEKALVTVGYGITDTEGVMEFDGSDIVYNYKTLPAAGVAFKAGDFYYGLLYKGIGAYLNGSTVTKLNIGEDTEATVKEDLGVSSYNSIDLLMGLNDSLANGFKLSFTENCVNGVKANTSIYNASFDREYFKLGGRWGCLLSDGDIRPYAGFSVSFDNSKTKEENTLTVGSTTYNSKSVLKTNYGTGFDVYAGLSADVVKKDNRKTTVAGSYELDTTFFKDNPSEIEYTSNVPGAVAPVTTPYIEKPANAYHYINASVTEKLTLSEKAKLSCSYYTYLSIYNYKYSRETDTDRVYSNSSLYWGNSFAAGFQYAIKPEFATLNLGTELYLPTLYSSKIDNNETPAGGSYTQTKSFGNGSTAHMYFYTGVDFNFTNELNLDLGLSLGTEENTFGLNNISVGITYKK